MRMAVRLSAKPVLVLLIRSGHKWDLIKKLTIGYAPELAEHHVPNVIDFETCEGRPSRRRPFAFVHWPLVRYSA
jgi:hypothetical protein